MKLYGWEDNETGKVTWYNPERLKLQAQAPAGHTFIGTIEGREPKKMVTKQAERRNFQPFADGSTEYRFDIPANATNVRCLYDLEE